MLFLKRPDPEPPPGTEAQPPAFDPGPGEDTDGRLGDQIAAGTFVDPDRGDPTTAGAPRVIPFQSGPVYPPQAILGHATRPVYAPSAPVTTLHGRYNVPGGVEGLHGEVVVTVGTPAGEQRPYGSARPKTFRAAPAPMDADVYAGFVPAQPMGDE